MQYRRLLALYDNLWNTNQEKKSSGIHDYSLMNALLKKTDEVNLHSNFIYSMINPKSSHYCGNIFLKYFLEAINEPDFINLNDARVHKEVGKIDLLIEDGEKVIIIENKLRAPDQKHQISRYIKYSIGTYLTGKFETSDDLENKIHIVYLSEYKRIPSAEQESCFGFKELTKESKELIWKNSDVELHNSGKLSLPTNTKLKFNRVQHSKELFEWIEKSNNWLRKYKLNDTSNSLTYAFNEYKLILKRLDIKKQWRNLMSLDDYTIELPDDEQKMMYEFMKEATIKINTYKGKKLYQALEKYFLEIENCKDLDSKKEFNELACIDWFNMKGSDYKNIGFEFIRDNKKYIFELATKYIYFGVGNHYDKNNRIAKKNDDIFIVTERLKSHSR